MQFAKLAKVILFLKIINVSNVEIMLLQKMDHVLNVETQLFLTMTQLQPWWQKVTTVLIEAAI